MGRRRSGMWKQLERARTLTLTLGMATLIPTASAVEAAATDPNSPPPAAATAAVPSPAAAAIPPPAGATAAVPPTAEAPAVVPPKRGGPLPRLNKQESDKRATARLPEAATTPTSSAVLPAAPLTPVEPEPPLNPEPLAQAPAMPSPASVRVEPAAVGPNPETAPAPAAPVAIAPPPAPAAPAPTALVVVVQPAAPVAPAPVAIVPQPPAPAPMAVAPAPVAPAPAAPMAVAPPPSPAEDRAPEPPRHAHHWRWNTEPGTREDSVRVQLDRAAEAGSEEAIARALEETASSQRLDSEEQRQAYIAVADRLQNDSLRSRVLRTLLARAPISDDTGRAVLLSASKVKSDPPLGHVLWYMHRIREADLVRGPLAEAYLDAVEKLRSEGEVTNALVNELHGQEITMHAVVRSLRIATRIHTDAQRARVLREVTDHQEIDGEVDSAYRMVADGMHDETARRQSYDALAAADQRNDGRARRRFHARAWFHAPAQHDAPPPPPAVPAVDPEVKARFERELDHLKAQQKQLQEQAERMRAEAQKLVDMVGQQTRDLQERLRKEFHDQDGTGPQNTRP